jgi:hypothetical protein
MTRRPFRLLVLTLAGLLASQISSRAGTTDTVLAKSAVLEGNVAYLRVGLVGTNLADEISAALTVLAVSNKIAGTVLDLRFANGDDLDSALGGGGFVRGEKIAAGDSRERPDARRGGCAGSGSARKAGGDWFWAAHRSRTLRSAETFRRCSRTSPCRSLWMTNGISCKIPTGRRRKMTPIQWPRQKMIFSRLWITRPRRIWSAPKSRMAIRTKIPRRRPAPPGRNRKSSMIRPWRGRWI